MSEDRRPTLCIVGFFIRLFFVCTCDPEINVHRITKRFIEGGHEVPISKIISSYYKSLTNAALAIDLFGRAYIYDNSVENALPQLLYRTVDGQVFKQYTDEMPELAEMLVK